jgi:hypothetical protein
MTIRRSTVSGAEPSKRIKIISLINSVCSLLINFDHGIIPAVTTEIKSELLLTDLDLGILGSAVYAGLLLGSVFGTYIF